MGGAADGEADGASEGDGDGAADATTAAAVEEGGASTGCVGAAALHAETTNAITTMVTASPPERPLKSALITDSPSARWCGDDGDVRVVEPLPDVVRRECTPRQGGLLSRAETCLRLSVGAPRGGEEMVRDPAPWTTGAIATKGYRTPLGPVQPPDRILSGG